MRTVLALVQISFYNLIRQSFFSLIMVGCYLFILSSPAFTMFTFFNAKKLILDMGMATILLAVLSSSVLGIFSIVGGEMEEKTSTLLLSKPISRFTFLLSKILAVSFSLLLIIIPLIIVLIMTLRMGVPEAVYSKVEYYILWFEFMPLLLAVVFAGASNYYADKNFGSSFIISFNILVFLSLFFLYLLEKNSLQLNLFKPALLLWMSGIIMAPIASILSLKGKISFALTFSFLIFILGLTSDYLFKKLLTNQGVEIIYSLIPNFQVFWSEEFWHEGVLSIKYLLKSAEYTFFYTFGMIFLGLSIWEREEISGGR